MLNNILKSSRYVLYTFPVSKLFQNPIEILETFKNALQSSLTLHLILFKQKQSKIKLKNLLTSYSIFTFFYSPVSHIEANIKKKQEVGKIFIIFYFTLILRNGKHFLDSNMGAIERKINQQPNRK